MKSSALIAVFITIAALAWIGSGALMKTESNPPEASSSVVQDEKTAKLQQVRVRALTAENYTSEVIVTGRTQASRSVVLRAETEGQVAELLKEKGDAVEEGEVLAKIDNRDRSSRVKEAQERVKQREIEYNAAQKLEDKGFNSRVRLAQARADLESARAELKEAQVDLANIEIKAPFSGVIYEQSIELGDFLSVGDDVFTIVDLDPIEVAGFLSERQVGDVTTGALAHAQMLNGEKLEGVISFVAPAANPETRTFRVELTVPNEDYAVKDGLTTRMFIPTKAIKAYKISPSILSLNDEGKIGVKIVDEDNRVQFLVIKILSDTPDYMWISGVPDEARLITVGQEFVAPGQIVDPVIAEGDGLL